MPSFSDVRAALKDKQGIKIGILGDSISEIDRNPGWFGGASKRELHYSQIFRRGMVEAYGHERILPIYAGHGGQNTYQAAGRVEYQLAAPRPQVLVVALGANDHDYQPLSVEQSAFALEGILRFAAAVWTPATLVMATSFALTWDAGAVAQRVDAQRAVCAKVGIPFVDTHALILEHLQKGGKWTDYFPHEADCHPNDAGHELWGRALWDAFEKA